jgi:mRNA-degrading endonuclease toxin of MazEF toxin-antitoxin module
VPGGFAGRVESPHAHGYRGSDDDQRASTALSPGVPIQGQKGLIVLDQLRTVDQVRFIRRLGRLDSKTSTAVLEVLQEMFAP